MTVGWRFSSGESTTTNCDMPVTSSNCSCMVMPSSRSLKCTVPLTSVSGTADLGQDGEGVGIPLQQDLVGLDGRPVFHHDLGAVYHLIALFLAAFLVDHGHDAVAVHGDQFAPLAAHGLHADVAGEAVGLGVLGGLFGNTGGRSADVEGTHSELRTGFADGLRGDDADGFSPLHQPSGGQVAAVAHHADAALRFASEHRSDFDALDAGSLNGGGQVFGD